MTQFAFVTFEPTTGLLKSVISNPETNLQSLVDSYVEGAVIETTGTDEDGVEHTISIPLISPTLGTIATQISIPNDDTDYAVIVANADKSKLAEADTKVVNIKWSVHEILVNDTLVKHKCNPELVQAERGHVENQEIVTNELIGSFLLDSDDIYEAAQNRIIDNVTIDLNSNGDVEFIPFLQDKKIVSTDGVLSLETIEE